MDGTLEICTITEGDEDEKEFIISYIVWECSKYHVVVWVPKKRRKIVYGKLRKEIGEILRRLSKYKGLDVI